MVINILSIFFENQYIKNFIAYLTLTMAFVMVFSFTEFNYDWIVGNETLEYGYFNNYISQGLLPSIFFNGFLVYRFKFCDWSLYSWMIVFLYSLAQYIEHELGIMLPNWCIIGFNLVMLFLAIFVVINLLKVNFKCCQN